MENNKNEQPKKEWVSPELIEMEIDITAGGTTTSTTESINFHT